MTEENISHVALPFHLLLFLTTCVKGMANQWYRYRLQVYYRLGFKLKLEITGLVYINVWSHLWIVPLERTTHKPRIHSLCNKVWQHRAIRGQRNVGITSDRFCLVGPKYYSPTFGTCQRKLWQSLIYKVNNLNLQDSPLGSHRHITCSNNCLFSVKWF